MGTRGLYESENRVKKMDSKSMGMRFYVMKKKIQVPFEKMNLVHLFYLSTLFLFFLIFKRSSSCFFLIPFSP